MLHEHLTKLEFCEFALLSQYYSIVRFFPLSMRFVSSVIFLCSVFKFGNYGWTDIFHQHKSPCQLAETKHTAECVCGFGQRHFESHSQLNKSVSPVQVVC